MSELVLLCNDQTVYCNSQDYYCDGSVVVLDFSYDTTSFTDVSYDSATYLDVEYLDYWYLWSSDSYFLLDSNGLYLVVEGATEQLNVEY